jgi:hypothetical protein
VQSDLFTAQGDIASGLTMDFDVKPDLVGLIIGKKVRNAHMNITRRE